MPAVILRNRIFDTQVCVPSDWTDEEVERFVNAENPSGTERRWTIRRTEPVRAQCAGLADHVHVVLEC